MSDKSAYAYLGRVFKELWISPKKSWLEKIGTTTFVVLASPLIFAGVLAFYAWRFFARRWVTR